MTDTTDWGSWDVVRPRGQHRRAKTVRYGADTAPAVGMFFQVGTSRPLHLTALYSPTDGGVVTHSLRRVTEDEERWVCDDDSYSPGEFEKLWPGAVIFPPDWRFRYQDYDRGLDPALRRLVAGA